MVFSATTQIGLNGNMSDLTAKVSAPRKLVPAFGRKGFEVADGTVVYF